MLTCWWCHFNFQPLNSISNVGRTDLLIRDVKLTLWGVCRRSRGTTASVSPGPGCMACSGQRRNTLFGQQQDDLTEQVYLEVTHLFTTVSLWQPCWRHSCRDKQKPEHRITKKTSTKLLLSVERSDSTCTGGCCDLGEGFPAARSDPPATQEENTLKSLHFNSKPAERRPFKKENGLQIFSLLKFLYRQR